MQELILYGCENFPEIRDKYVKEIIYELIKTKYYDQFIKYLDIVIRFDQYFLENIIDKLFYDKQFEIILTIAEKTPIMNTHIFWYRNIVKIFSNCDIQLLQKFIDCNPNILSKMNSLNSLGELSRSLYWRGDIQIIELVMSILSESQCILFVYIIFGLIIYKNDVVMAKYFLDNHADIIRSKIAKLLEENYIDSIDVFKMVLEKYPNIDKQSCYIKAYQHGYINILRYLLNNYHFDLDIINSIDFNKYNFFIYNNHINVTTKIVLDKIIEHDLLNSDNIIKIFEMVYKTNCVEYFHMFQNYDISYDDINKAFRYACKRGYFEMAKIIKYTYPDIDIKNIYCPSLFVDLRKWLNNNCVENYTNVKSARKMYLKI